MASIIRWLRSKTRASHPALNSGDGLKKPLCIASCLMTSPHLMNTPARPEFTWRREYGPDGRSTKNYLCVSRVPPNESKVQTVELDNHTAWTIFRTSAGICRVASLNSAGPPFVKSTCIIRHRLVELHDSVRRPNVSSSRRAQRLQPHKCLRLARLCGVQRFPA